MARQYYNAEQGGSDITVISNITWADAVELAFTPDASTSYYLFFSGLIGNSSATSDIQYQVLEGANVIASGNIEPKDTSPTEYRSFAGFLRHTEGGSPSARSFKIQIKLETSGPTGRIRSARLTAIRHESGDVFEETTAAFTTGSAIDSVVESISTTSVDATADSWIVFACAKLKAGTANAAIWISMEKPKDTDPSEEERAYAIETYSDTTSAVHKMLGFYLYEDPNYGSSGGAYDLMVTTPAGTTSVSDRRILALKVTGDNVFADYDVNGNSLSPYSGTTYGDAYTYSPSLAKTGDHLAFLSLSSNNDDSTVSYYTDFTIAGTVISESVRECSDQDTHMYVGVESLVAGSNAVKARTKGETGTPQQVLFEISFVIWQLEVPKSQRFRRRQPRFFSRRF